MVSSNREIRGSPIMRLIAVIATGAWIWTSSALAGPLKPETERLIDTEMTRMVESGVVPGGVVAVSRGDQVLLAKGYGAADLEAGTRVGPDTVFRIGSVTKQFTAALVLLLAEDGKLSLDDRVAKHLPEFPQDDPTTIRQMLNHTSGLDDYTGRPGFRQRETWLPLTSAEMTAYIISASPLHQFQPGERWAYSNSNHFLAGVIAERVGGKPLATLMQERLFGPIGMTRTALDVGPEVVIDRARGYYRPQPGQPFANAPSLSMTTPGGSGAIRSTARDLLAWAEALHGGRVLKPESYREFLSPAVLNDGTTASAPRPGLPPAGYGLGVAVDRSGGETQIMHGGGIAGFTAFLVTWLEDDTTVVLLVNGPGGPALPLIPIMNALAADGGQ